MPAGSFGYRTIVVPLADNAESDQAVDVACRLAADHGGALIAVAVVEVPTLLPVDAHMPDEERRARRLLRRADAVGESYGIDVARRLVRSRDAAHAIVECAVEECADVIVIGAPRHPRRPLGHTAEAVLRSADCRVILIAAPAEQELARIAV